MNRLELGRRIRQELGGLLKLSPLVVASLLLVAVLWGADSAVVSGLFQSSPVERPSATPTETPTIMVSAEPSLTPAASPEVTATVPITATVPVTETATALPTETPAVTETPLPTDTSTPPATDTAVPEATPDENLRYADEDSKLKFEWGMLFDALALFFSYAWLICGILLFLAVPVFLYFLWRASQRRREGIQQGED